MKAYATTIATLRPDQLADLRLVHDDAQYPLQPQRRKMFVALGLIRPAQPPRQPTKALHQKPRAHVLTELGERAIATTPPAERDPLRRPPSAGYASEKAARRSGGRAS